MNRISQALIDLAEALEAKGSADMPGLDAPVGSRGHCEVCEVYGIDLGDEPDELDDWRDELEEGESVPRASIESYAEDIAQAAILNAATVARIGRKWGFVVE
jgi:hypothetical protein